MIETRDLTKRCGRTVAVDGLSFDVRPGTVTGFLGPNGSGKSTTMRMLIGLDRFDGGDARIGGRPYSGLGWPLREVGALLEAKSFQPGRSARAHLTALAASNGIPRRRVEEVLAIVGLEQAAGSSRSLTPCHRGPGWAGPALPVHGGPALWGRRSAGQAGCLNRTIERWAAPLRGM